MDDPTLAGVLYAAWSGDSAIVCPAPPGSGKSRLVVLLAASLAERAGLRVGIAAQTRDQAVEVARRLDALGHPAVLAWIALQPTPIGLGEARAERGHRVRFSPTGGGVVVATTARWLVSDPSRLGCDVMIVDEAWQLTFADLGGLGAFADLAVVTSHVGQAAAVQALLADLPGVLIGTANQLQGLERHAVVALHPLAGYREASGFAANPGRACVMLSRHTWRWCTTTRRPPCWPGRTGARWNSPTGACSTCSPEA